MAIAARTIAVLAGVYDGPSQTGAEPGAKIHRWGCAGNAIEHGEGRVCLTAQSEQVSLCDETLHAFVYPGRTSSMG